MSENSEQLQTLLAKPKSETADQNKRTMEEVKESFVDLEVKLGKLRLSVTFLLLVFIFLIIWEVICQKTKEESPVRRWAIIIFVVVTLLIMLFSIYISREQLSLKSRFRSGKYDPWGSIKELEEHEKQLEESVNSMPLCYWYCIGFIFGITIAWYLRTFEPPTINCSTIQNLTTTIPPTEEFLIDDLGHGI